MRTPARLCASLALLLFTGLLCRPSFAQVSFRWFDINPSRSNTDDSDPNGASGGRVNHVGAASDLSRVYAATEWGGLYTSFDQGNTWVRVNTYSPTTTWDVKVDPRNAQHVFVTSFFDGRVTPRSGISISNDGGNTWATANIPGLSTMNCATPQTRTQPSAWQIAINPTTPSNIFVGTSCGLARSFDNGATWNLVDPSPGNPAEQIFAVIAHGAGFVDVIGANGHFRSTNNGNTWSPALAGPGPGPTNSFSTSTIAVSPQENYVLLAANGTNIWESDNGGTSWPTSLNLPLIGSNSNAQGRIPFVKTNQLSTSTQFNVWYGDINLFKTTATTPSTQAPGGSPRTPINSWASMQDKGHWDNGDILFDPRFSAGACPKIFSSDGGVYLNQEVNNPRCQSPSWEQPTITPHATWVWGFDGRRLSAGNHAITYGLQDDGGYAATNVAEGHNPPAPNWNNYICCDVSDNTEDGGNGLLSLEGSFGSGRAFRLTKRNTGGGGDSEISNYPSASGLGAFDSGEGAIRFGNKAYVVNVPNGGVFFTNDITGGSISWTPLSAPTAATSSSGNLKIATLGGRPNVYYQTSDGNPSNIGVIFRSSLVATSGAAGSNWIPLPLPAGIGSVNTYDVDPNDGNHIIISGINNVSNNFEIWITRDFGGNWTPLPQLTNLMLGAGPGGGGVFVNRPDQGLSMACCTLPFGSYWQPSLLKFNPNDSTTIVAGAVDAGLFVSLNDGNNWQLISNPVNPTSASPHIPRPIDAYFSPGRFNASTNAFDVWVATRGAGVHKVVLERRP